MALSIKTEEADRLARELTRLTGETLTEAVTTALRERCDRERAKYRTPEQKIADVNAFLDSIRGHYDTRPVTKEEWDEASGDTD
jgi:antitoxin VapB